MTIEADDFDDFINESFNDEKPEGKERRNSKRFEGLLTARFQDEQCVVLNVSENGVMLETNLPVHFFPLDKTIEFELRLKEQWIRIKGRVMWIQNDSLHSKIGLFIQEAQDPYFRFLQELTT